MTNREDELGEPTCLVLVRLPGDQRNPDPNWSQSILDGVDRLARELGFKPQHVDPRHLGIQARDSEAFRLLERADLAVVDVHAGSNDYIYLLGARHALTSKPTVILNRVEYLPFDVKGPPAGVIQANTPDEMLEHLRLHLQSVLDNSWQATEYSLLRRALDDRPHVFLSYAHADKESVRAVDQWLRDKGARVEIDERDFIVGQDIRDEIVRLISTAGKVICFYSRASENRYYTRLERRIVEEREQELHGSRSSSALMLYLRLDDTKLPAESSHRLALNAWEMDFETACQELWRNILEQSAEPKRIDLSRYRKKAPWAR